MDLRPPLLLRGKRGCCLDDLGFEFLASLGHVFNLRGGSDEDTQVLVAIWEQPVQFSDFFRPQVRVNRPVSDVKADLPSDMEQRRFFVRLLQPLLFDDLREYVADEPNIAWVEPGQLGQRWTIEPSHQAIHG